MSNQWYSSWWVQVLSGGIVATAFLLPVTWPLGLIAWVPILLQLLHGESMRRLSINALLMSVSWIWIMNGSMIISDYASRTSVVMSGVLLLPILWTVPVFLTGMSRRLVGNFNSVLLFPLFWISYEVLQFYWPLNYTRKSGFIDLYF